MLELSFTLVEEAAFLLVVIAYHVLHRVCICQLLLSCLVACCPSAVTERQLLQPQPRPSPSPTCDGRQLAEETQADSRVCLSPCVRLRLEHCPLDTYFDNMKPTEFQPLDDDLSEELRASCRPGLMPMAGVLVSPPGTAMPEEFKLYADRLRDFEVRDDDTWVISYPKCGTTWTQEMVWLIGNNCDFDAAAGSLLLQRFPFLEAVSIIPQPKVDEQAQFLDEHVLFADTIQFVEEQPSPRFIKSHLPVELLPKQIWTKKPKIIYVTRNPMDAAISYYHHHRLWNGYVGSYETFMEGFLNDKLVYSPFWDHVLEYKKMENQDNMLIISFEEMKRNLKSIIQQTSEFLGKKLTADQIDELSDHLSFSNMKNNPTINGEDFIKEVKEKHDMPEDDPELTFIRKGQVGAWKKELPHHFVEKFKSWTKEKLRGTTYTEDDFYLTQ